MKTVPVQHANQIPIEVKNEDLDAFWPQNEKKKVWAEDLDLEDEKVTDLDLLYYIEEFFKLGRILEAAGLVSRLSDESQRSERIRFILKEKSSITTRIQELESLDDWTLQVDGNVTSSKGVSIYYKYTSGSPIISIKSVFRVNANLGDLCCVANEIDLWSMFLSKLLTVDTKNCARYGFSSMVPYLNIHMPWPMAHRECYVEMRVYDLITTKKKLLMFCEDLGKRTHILGFKVPAVPEGAVRMKTTIMGLGKSVSLKVTDLTVICKFDMAMPLPQWLVNWFTRQVSWRVYREFQDLCSALPNAHLERKKMDKTGVYKYLEDRLKILFGDHPKTASK